MPKPLFILIGCCCSLLLTSCATVFSNSLTTVTAHTKKPSKIVYKNDTLQTTSNRLTIYPERSAAPLKLQIINDSISKEIAINPRSTALFYSNIFNYGIGFIWDWNNPNRYTYPTNITIENDGSLKKSAPPKPSKGKVDLTLSIPYLNAFSLQPKGEVTKSSAGFFGAAIGLDYHYREKQFVNFTLGAATDFMVPFPAAVDYDSNYEVFSSTYASVTNNHLFNRFSLGYGFSLNRNTWSIREGMGGTEPGEREPVRKRNTALGLSFATMYRVGRTFHLGLTYKPAFVNFTAGDTFTYEHVISFELLWKFRL